MVSPSKVGQDFTPSNIVPQTTVSDHVIHHACKYLVGSLAPFSPFAKENAAEPLRVCCIGSFSATTPACFLGPAAEVGYLLAKRGHTCVVGAGSSGCMSAIIEGAAAGNGNIVGVIHKMWLNVLHSAFDASSIRKSRLGSFMRLGGHKGVPIRELHVVDGKDLYEQKRLLRKGAHAMIVLPGGPGTWEELWDMAAARNTGQSDVPIVCVNINGFYNSFQQILQHAWEEKVTTFKPEDVVHFADTAEEAVKWIEERGSPAVRYLYPVVSEWTVFKDETLAQWTFLSVGLGTGLALGLLLSRR